MSRPALAVAGDGRALLVYGDTVDGPVTFERPPGGAFARVAVGGRDGAEWPAVALRRGGGAVIAWKGFGENVYAVRRSARTAFGAVERVAGESSSPFGLVYAELVGSSPFGARPYDADNAQLAAALAPDGRALLAWAEGTPARPWLASGTLSGGFGAPQRLGSPLRDANGVVPLFLAGGRAAVAWTDNAGLGSQRDLPRGGGRLHLAVDGAPRTAGPAPAAHDQRPPQPAAVRVAGAARHGALRPRVRRARSARRQRRRVRRREREPVERRSAAAARTGHLALRRRGAAPRRPRRRAGDRARRRARGARGAAHADHHPPRAAGAAPARAARAPRRRDVIVAWRTRRPARRVWFLVAALRARRGEPVDDQALEYVNGRGRTRFRVVLRPRRPGAVRWVNVAGYSIDGSATRTNRVRVR